MNCTICEVIKVIWGEDVTFTVTGIIEGNILMIESGSKRTLNVPYTINNNDVTILFDDIKDFANSHNTYRIDINNECFYISFYSILDLGIC